jgi:hypothetical protein
VQNGMQHGTVSQDRLEEIGDAMRRSAT